MSQSTTLPTMPTRKSTITPADAHADFERRTPQDEDPSIKETECFFLDRIPGEMRNRIYEYALTSDDSVATLKFSILVPKPPYISPEVRRAMQIKRALELKHERKELPFACAENQRQVQELDAKLRERTASMEAENHREKMQYLEGETREKRGWRLLRNRMAREREMMPMKMLRHTLTKEIAKMENYIQILPGREKRLLEGKEESESKPMPHADIIFEDEHTDRRKLSFRDVDNVLALSLTCKQIRHECSGLAHEYNSFRFVTKMIKQDHVPDPKVDRQLKHIAARQVQSREIKRGLIIDLGNFSNDRGYPPLTALNEYISANSESLRKLHKSTESLTLAFTTGVDDQTGLRTCLTVKVEWQLPLGTPEAIEAYFDQKARSETRLVGEQVRSARAKVLRLFFPNWAVRNGY